MAAVGPSHLPRHGWAEDDGMREIIIEMEAAKPHLNIVWKLLC